MTNDDELRALTERVRVIEERLAHEQAPGPDEPVAADFWALEGIRARTGDGAGAVVFAGQVETGDGPVEWQYGHTVESLQEMEDPELDQVAARLAALGSPVRLKILRAVLRGRTSTAQLSELDEVGTSGQIYHHLRALTAAGWLRTVSRGVVAVPPERVVPAWVALSLAR